MRIELGVIPKKFLVRPAKFRSGLAVLLEIPSLSRLGIVRWHNTQQPTQVPQLPAKGPGNATNNNSQTRREKTQCSKWGNQEDCPNFLESPLIFPECIRNNESWMSKEPGLTDLENQMEQTEFAAGHLIDLEIAIDSLLLKRKQQNGGVEIANEYRVQNELYH